MIGYVRCFDSSNKTLLFKVIDKNLLKNIVKYGEKIGTLMNINFDSEPIYGNNGKYIKTKIKS